MVEPWIEAAVEEMRFCRDHDIRMFWISTEEQGPAMYVGSPSFVTVTGCVDWLWLPLWGPPPIGRGFDTIIPRP